VKEETVSLFVVGGGMMKRTLVLLFVAVPIVATAGAGDLTPEELMQKFMSCIACAPYMEYPELGTGLKWDTEKTTHGMLLAQTVTDEALLPKLRECEVKLKVSRAAAMEMSPEEASEKLCPFCSGVHALIGRGDVEFEEVALSLGTVTMATSGTDEGVAAIHAHVDESHKMMEMMEAAAPEKKEAKQE
jgi:hypothetical protein